MRKYILVSLMIMLILACSGCMKETEIKKEDLMEADNYNCFNKTLLYSSVENKIEKRITQKRTSEDTIGCSIIAHNSSKWLINERARIGLSDEWQQYNDFYLMDYGNQEMIEWECPMLADNAVYNACMDDGGDIFLYDLLSGMLSKCNESGDLLEQIDLYDTIGESRQGYVEIKCDTDYLYAIEGVTLCLNIFDHELNLLYRMQPEEKNRCFMAANQKGSVMLMEGLFPEKWIFHTYSGPDGYKKLKYSYSSEKFSCIDTNNIFDGDAEYDFYSSTNFASYIQDYDDEDFIGIKDGEIYRIFSIKQMGFDHVPQVFSIGDENYIVNYYNSSLRMSEIYLLEKCDNVMDYSMDAGKEKLRIGCFMTGSLENAGTAFNNRSEDFYVEFVNYADQYEDINDAERQLNIDLAVNQNLDGVLLFRLDKDNLIEKDVLLDLGEYFDRPDGVKEEDFVPFIREGMKSADGKIYSIYPQFSLAGLVSGEEVSLEQMAGYQGITKRQEVFTANADPLDELNSLMRYSGTRFINEETGELHLDDGFRNLLMVLKEGQDSGITKHADSKGRLIEEKQAHALFAELVMPYSYPFYTRMFGADIHCTNYGTPAPVIVPGFEEIGITSYCEHKEGMYAFLDFLFAEENYKLYFGNMYFPVLEDFYEEWMYRMTATENYTNRFGIDIAAMDFSYGSEGLIYNLPPMSREEAEKMQAFFESSVYVKPLNRKYIVVLDEEAQYYFNGDRDIEETCRILENRITTILKEK